MSLNKEISTGTTKNKEDIISIKFLWVFNKKSQHFIGKE